MIAAVSAMLFSGSAFAAYGGGGGGGYSLGINLGIVNSSQSQMNEMIKRANSSEGGISTSALNQAYEAALFFMYRFSGTMYAIQLRPSYYYQQENGSGAGGAYKYGVKGYTVFPIFRLYPLENEFMKFYLQIGLGYGRVNGSIIENSKTSGAASVDFSGGAFGSLTGLGAEFCLTANHCFSLEANYRYLTFDRLLADSSSGTFASNSLSQYGANQEVELDGEDLSVRMGGLIFMEGYTYWF
jgi:opacity protein-like surface antigen